MEDKYIVWEHIKNKTRFMTAYIENKIYKDNENHKIIAEKVSYDLGTYICSQNEKYFIDNFLKTLPDEIRSPEINEFVTELVKEDN
jgi:hypothetical protein